MAATAIMHLNWGAGMASDSSVAHLAIGFPGLVAAPALQVIELDGAELVRRAADINDARRPAYAGCKPFSRSGRSH